MTVAIRATNLSKCYSIAHADSDHAARYRTIREGLSSLVQRPFRRRGDDRSRTQEEHWALRDVDFEVRSGEVTGIIGHNGAGKSTLLKILSRITRPTSGRVEIQGRIGSLLEVGTGFHPELTGRENIALNGAILGMSRQEIRRQFEAIVDFAGVEKFLDTPVKRYSSGMYVRLAFAVAAHLEPEVLVIDEVLAVGDQSFQNKCVGKINSLHSGGRTVLIVSHNLPLLANLCTTATWLDHGRVVKSGRIQEILQSYSDHYRDQSRTGSSICLDHHPGRTIRRARVLRRVSITDSSGAASAHVPLGSSFTVTVELDGGARALDSQIEIEICDQFGTKLAEANSHTQSFLDLSGSGTAVVQFQIDSCLLIPGDYTLNVGLGDTEDYLEKFVNVMTLSVLPSDIYGTGRCPTRRNGYIALPGSWSLGSRRPIDNDPIAGCERFRTLVARSGIPIRSGDGKPIDLDGHSNL